MNQTLIGSNTTVIQEEFPEPDPKPLDESPEYSKKVWVANTSSGVSGEQTDCYVRVSLSYSNYDVAKALTLQNLNTAEWVYHSQDGYYYYKTPLKEGEQTKPLFTGFRIDSSGAADAVKEGISDFSIQVYEESVQAAGFKTYQEAWNYYLNPVAAA